MNCLVSLPSRTASGLCRKTVANMSVPGPRRTSLPLSSAQLGVWVAHQLNPTEPTYNLAKYLDIRGPVDAAEFAHALRQAELESEIFYVRLREEPTGLVQEPADVGSSLHVIDLSEDPDPVAAAEAWMRKDWLAPVDLLAGGLFTDALFKIEEERHLWYSRCHHLLVDGYSDLLLTRRLSAIYTERMLGTPAGAQFEGCLESLLDSETEYRASPQHRKDRAYWTDRFADRPELSGFTGRTAAQVPGEFLRRRVRLADAELAAVYSAGREARMAWSVVLIAAVAIYLRAMTGQDEVAMGIPVTGRLPGTLQTPGMLANELPLRLRVAPTMTKRKLLRVVSAELSGLLEHQCFPYGELRRELGMSGGGGQLFGPSVNILSGGEKLNFGGHPAYLHRLANGPVKDLSITVSPGPGGDGLSIDFDANPTLYSDEDLAAHQVRFLHVLNAFAKAGLRSAIGGVNPLTSLERGRLLGEWIDTEVPRPAATVPGLFAEQVARVPGAVAVLSGRESLTYAQLDARADILARRLAALGVGEGVEDRVAILVRRSADSAVSALAVLKAGGAYVPLDPRFPVDRQAAMVRDSGAKVVLTDGDVLFSHSAKVLQMEASGSGGPNARNVTPRAQQSPDALACVLFTSGSTGVPKGVALTHGGIADLVRDGGFTGGAQERVLMHASPAFDASLYEMWVPLLTGGCVVVAPDGGVDAEVLRTVITLHGVTALLLTAGLFRLVAQDDPGCLAGLREVWSGGDVVPALEVRRVLEECPGITVVDAYGPTEATVMATRHAAFTPGEVSTVMPIGRPLDNTRVYVLDAALKPVVAGAPGELYIAGAGLARGYLDRPDMTAERFVADPFGRPGTRMYRTGDVVRWTQGGELVFVGRSDDQVKIRGFRVEPAEVEAVVASFIQVSQAAVAVQEDQAGVKRLVAYAVPISGVVLDVEALRDHVASALPMCMVPAMFVPLDSMPMTRSGKIDRQALVAHQFTGNPTGRAPETERETVVCALFAEVLGLAKVSADDNFFELGGDSIVAIQLVARARKLGLLLSPQNIFTHKTVAALAASAQEWVDIPEVSDVQPLVSLTLGNLPVMESRCDLSEPSCRP